MNMQLLKQIGLLIFLASAAFELPAQQRPGGGGGGFGGFGGFGGLGGLFGGNQTGNRATTSQYNNNGTVGGATIYVDRKSVV